MFSRQHPGLWRTLADRRPSAAEAVALVSNAAPYDCRIVDVLQAADLGQGGPLDAAIVQRSRRLRAGLFAGQVYAVVPVYATSVCSENCLYCNYRSGNKGVGVERLRLSDEELVSEAEFLVDQKGLRALELVYAADPLVRADSMCRHVELFRELLERRGGGIVGLSAEALEEEEYRRLLGAGLSFSVLWQETYDPVRYRELHPGATKKARIEYRLDAYERMLSAGIPFTGIGILSGLADWRKDWTMLMLHEDYLRRTCGRGAAILGTARLKPAPGALEHAGAQTPTTPEYLATVALHGIFSPETLPFVSTREEWDVCVELSRGGGCLFTFNCSTIPGGYSLGHRGAQFQNRSYDAPLFRRRLEETGVSPVFRWSFEEVLPSWRAAQMPAAVSQPRSAPSLKI